jgi:hypothetical protein
VLIRRFIWDRVRQYSALSQRVDDPAFSACLSASSTPAYGERVISNQPCGVRQSSPVTHRSDPIVTVHSARPESYVARCNYRL